MGSSLSAEPPAPDHKALTWKPGRTSSSFRGQGCGLLPAIVACQVRRRQPCIRASESSQRHAIARRDCRSRRAAHYI